LVDALGQYRILERLSGPGVARVGGVGDLYRARDTRTGRTVALDVVPPAVAADPERRARFLTRARAAARLSHPNIAALYEVGEDKGEIFLAFEFAPGDTVKTILSHGPMNARRAIELAAQVGDGLADAHGWGILHGDLRPDNILETSKGRAKILDFGLAEWTIGGSDRADSAATPSQRPTAYLAPEQKAGRPVDERADVFSLGVVLYEMLAGKRPPEAARPALAAANPDLHQEIDAILAKAMAAKADDRYSCAATMVAELLAVLAILNERATRQRLTQ
jgi:serine/threonine-protein kinase